VNRGPLTTRRQQIVIIETNRGHATIGSGLWTVSR
jgi:hypothetical protein